jgi:hypothetical protein
MAGFDSEAFSALLREHNMVRLERVEGQTFPVLRPLFLWSACAKRCSAENCFGSDTTVQEWSSMPFPKPETKGLQPEPNFLRGKLESVEYKP